MNKEKSKIIQDKMMKSKLKNSLASNSSGITVIALIITVVVMLILAGVAISVLVDGDGLFTKTRTAAEEYKSAADEEAAQVSDWIAQIDEYLSGVPSNPGGGDDEEEEPGDDVVVDQPIDSATLAAMTNGSWNGTVNTPKLATGMTAVYWDNGVETELTAEDTEEEWNNWYSYTAQTGSTATAGSGTSKWANAVTKNNGADNIAGNEDDEITGYWVWIPRFEYSLTAPASGSAEGTPGTIAVNFIETTTTTASSTAYKVHPVFTTNTDNGGWGSDIPGFWVAKYPAGFQASTVTAASIGADTITLENGTDTVEFSGLKYTAPGNDYTANAIGQDVGIANFASASLSYPVFKPLTYAYNCINIDSSFRIAQQIASTPAFYGISNVDSHQMKNSEWGAVAYLTWSQYGRNATEPNINNVNLDNKDSKNIYAVTGIYAGVDTTNNYDGTNNAHTAGNLTGNAYNTPEGQLGSSTGNITGVYDLNGCVWERVSAYIENTAGATNRNTYGAALVASDTSLNKYRTTYSSSSSDTRPLNYSANSVATRYGDAVLETSTAGEGSTSWNGNYSNFPYSSTPFFIRGGYCAGGESAGVFAFGDSGGYAGNYHGFRAALVSTL